MNIYIIQKKKKEKENDTLVEPLEYSSNAP